MQDLKNISEDEALRMAVDCGIISMEDISRRVQQMKRQEILSQHTYWQNKEGLWMTHFPDKKKGRIIRKRKSKEELENLIVEYYENLKEEI